jgi:hypothetical protein
VIVEKTLAANGLDRCRSVIRLTPPGTEMKLVTLTMFGAGYALGTKAGRQRSATFASRLCATTGDGESPRHCPKKLSL